MYVSKQHRGRSGKSRMPDHLGALGPLILALRFKSLRVPVSRIRHPQRRYWAGRRLVKVISVTVEVSPSRLWTTCLVITQ